MKKLSLSPVERSTILMSFQAPLQATNGGQRGADVTELRKAMRVFDKLRFDEFLSKPAGEDDTAEGVFELDDSDLSHVESVFKSAQIWVRNPKIAKIVIGIMDKIEAAKEEK